MGYESAKRALDDAYNTVTEEVLKEKIEMVEAAHVNSKHGLSWQIINEITGRRASQKGQIAGNTQTERIQSWYSHFQNLLGSPPIIENEDEEIPAIYTDLGIEDGPFTLGEYAKVKNTLTEGKSCGEDCITPEVLKKCNLDDIVLDFCNQALMGQGTPEQWSVLNIIPIPKSGDLSLGSNYRGISLSSVVSKVFNKMILNRIRSKLDQHLRINQNGFRPARTTVSQILALRRLIEGVKEHQLPAVITFIDFKKAFDTIHRGKMLKILRAYGIPDRLVEAISSIYRNNKAKVVSPDGETELFSISAGVLQGDTLAPFLFVIVLDYALRKALTGQEEELGFQLRKRQSRRVGAVAVTDLDFADDIALLSEQIEQAQEMLERVEKAAVEIGLHMNAKKTKTMAYNQEKDINITARDGSKLEQVHDFQYLGAWVDNTETDIKIRKAQAWKACNKLTKIWKSTLSRSIKISLFISTVESVLLYGCEAWTLTKRLEKQLDGCYTRMLRTVMGVHWSQHITNEDLYQGLPRLSEKIRGRRLQFAGHCLRRDDELVSKLLLWQPSHGQRLRGRRKLNYVDSLTSDTGLRIEELQTAMLDRTVWRATIVRGSHST